MANALNQAVQFTRLGTADMPKDANQSVKILNIIGADGKSLGLAGLKTVSHAGALPIVDKATAAPTMEEYNELVDAVNGLTELLVQSGIVVQVG
jgi:hypothetical protein